MRVGNPVISQTGDGNKPMFWWAVLYNTNVFHEGTIGDQLMCKIYLFTKTITHFRSQDEA